MLRFSAWPKKGKKVEERKDTSGIEKLLLADLDAPSAVTRMMGFLRGPQDIETSGTDSSAARTIWREGNGPSVSVLPPQG